MKTFFPLLISFCVLALAACRMDPESLLGGKSIVRFYKGITIPSGMRAAPPTDCHRKHLKLVHLENPASGCPMLDSPQQLFRVSKTGGDGFPLSEFEFESSGERSLLPRLAFLHYREKGAISTAELPARCAVVRTTQTDNITYRCVLEAAKAGETLPKGAIYSLNSIEFKKAKCNARVRYEAQFTDQGCIETRDQDYWVWANGVKVPDLIPEPPEIDAPTSKAAMNIEEWEIGGEASE